MSLQFVSKHNSTFKEYPSIFCVDLSLLDDYKEIVGFSFTPTPDEKGKLPKDVSIGEDVMMVMELLWVFNQSIENSDKSKSEHTIELDMRYMTKEYGTCLILEDYIPLDRKAFLWKYYKRKTEERDANNQLHIL